MKADFREAGYPFLPSVIGFYLVYNRLDGSGAAAHPSERLGVSYVKEDCTMLFRVGQVYKRCEIR